MKKVLFTLSLTLFALVTYSQARLELGLKGGMNFSSIKADDVEDVNLESKTGYHAGIYGMIKIANIGIQPEVLYSRKGATVKDFSGSAQEEWDNEFVYLDIPVIAKFYLPLGLNLQAGPQFGMLLSAESDGDDVKDAYKNSDISAALGAGWDAPFGLRLTARYLIGLNDIDDSGFDQEQKNRMFQVSLGYSLIKLGK
ncbi:porin family protein [Marinoscillum sp.]|uniref:porin family protein n=1 Tax=Marinoscillum sp. TaxID=2024838 RepID=UPI003BAC602A